MWGTLVPWRNGKTDDVSGNKVWTADFSSLTIPGKYYLLDPQGRARSFSFRIAQDVYDRVFVAAMRMYYYQRCGTAITEKYAGKWTHDLCHSQDASAPPAPSKNGRRATGPALDVSGGWHDAGDMNKYVPWTCDALWQLLTAYEWNPRAFGDDSNIPESGNGVPDVLDECKWELDWLLRMQRDDGGVNNRVAFKNYTSEGPGEDREPVFYTGETTWATASMAASCAHAAIVFAPFDKQYPGYAQRLSQAAQRAWRYLGAHPRMFPIDGTDGAIPLAAADADSGGENADMRFRVLAAADLFRLTHEPKYREYFDRYFDDVPHTSEGDYHPLKWAIDPTQSVDMTWAYYEYSISPDATPASVNRIRQSFRTAADDRIMPNYIHDEDPYRAYMYNGHYCWGSNSLKAKWGDLLLIAKHLGVNPSGDAGYEEAASEYLHYLHGRNPLSWCYLSNMGSFGAGKSPMQMYHGWFRNPPFNHGPDPLGPAPGYLVGGPNAFFDVTWISPPHGEPPMKAFKDWDAAWNAQHHANESSWEITEPDILYQSAYVMLASEFCHANSLR